MKKTLTVLLALILMLSVIPLTVHADTIKDDSAAFGVDMVIVLDMTKSMKQDENTGNDIYNYRSDATAMLIGMLDMDRSRVAIIPFTGSPIVKKTKSGKDISELQLVNKQEIRSELVDAIYELKEAPRTNIGAALMKANEILDSRNDKTNLAAIVLLTDGNNDMTSGDGLNTIDIINSWRWENGKIVNKGNERYGTEEAIEVTKEAVECAKTLNHPIYTVALNQDPELPPKQGGPSLLDISQGTGLEEGCWHVSKDNAQELPAFFAKVLAAKIGSSVQNQAKPVIVEGEENTYEVIIPVLNKSVLETNIIIPTKSNNKGNISDIDSMSIKVVDPDGTVRSASSDVYILREGNQGHFALVKIREPETAGKWKLRFTSKEDPDKISFNILYNYDIQLAASIKQGGQEQREFFKTDEISLQAQFVDGKGTPSTDEALYSDISGEPEFEEWMQIRTSWALYRVKDNGETEKQAVANGKLKADPVLCRFEDKINLGEAKLKSGDYILIVHAEGAGLDRNISIPIKLKNHQPMAMSEYTQNISVNSTKTGEEDTWDVAKMSGELEVKASDIVTDKDGDKLSFALRADEDYSDQAATMELDNNDTISYRLMPAENGEGIKDGKAVYWLIFDDDDTDGKGSVKITLDISSDLIALLNTYEPEIEVTGTNVGNSKTEYLKNTPITVTVKLRNKTATGTAQYADAELIERLGHRISITELSSKEEIVKNESMETVDNMLQFTYNTGNKSADWLVSVVLNFFDKPAEKTITIPNAHDPQPVSSEPLTLYCDGEKVPSFLTWLIGTETKKEVETDIGETINNPILDIYPTDLFTDDDNDELIIEDLAFWDPGTQRLTDSEKISAIEQEEGEDGKQHYLIDFDGKKTSLFNYSFDTDLNIIAKDGDQEQGIYTRRITVVDLYNKMLTYIVIALVVLIAFTILGLIIRQIRKPVFPILDISIREDESLYETGRIGLSPVKSKNDLNKIGIEVGLAENHGISVEFLQHIYIYPIESRASVGLILKKKVSDNEAKLDEVLLETNRKTIWNIGKELAISNKNGEGCMVLRLEPREDDGSYNDPSDDFSDNDNWSSDSEPKNGAGKIRRFSHEVQPKEKQPAKEESFASDNDDFDF